jgi:YfiR/HmsC-like
MALLRPRAWLFCMWLAIAVLAIGSPRATAAPSEYQVKAVFLFNFAQFVDWPATAFSSADAPFVIGVLGQDPFGSQLDEVVRGESVNKRPLVIERYRDVAEIHNCNILFIGSAESQHLDEILVALKGRSILTVSDADPAGQRGVMIRLVNESNRIRLRIDVAAAKAGNLTISSKLLRPAEIVGPGEG